MQNKPYISFQPISYADEYRCGLFRKPGFFRKLLNTAPNKADGENLRVGYSAYSNPDGITPPAGAQILKVASIQQPTQNDVHIWFANPSSQLVYMNPVWNSVGTRVYTNVNIGEAKTFTGATGSVATHALTITGADALGLSQANDYYNGWTLKNTTQDEYAQITDYAYSAADSGTSVFTVVETITSGGGLNWLATNAYTINRYFHSNVGFSPAYNTSLADPPTVRADDSVIRLSGGQSATAGNAGIKIYPKLNRTYFPASSTPYTYLGTYADKRECAAPTEKALTGTTGDVFLGTETTEEYALTPNKTYWLAFSYEYDGYQEGPLLRFETTSQYAIKDGTNDNYVPAGAYYYLSVPLHIQLGLLNKFVTGVNIYLATDEGDTRTMGRQNPYMFVSTYSFVESTGPAQTWAYTVAGYYTAALLGNSVSAVSSNVWHNVVNLQTTYESRSGIVEVPTDTMYSYSTETILGGRHYLADVYVTSESKADHEKIYTNPVNAFGVVAPDIFSNEDGFFRHLPPETTGKRINALIPVGVEELLVLRDRGAIIGRPAIADSYVDFQWQIIHPFAGCTCANQWVESEESIVYFAGVDDIYAYSGGRIQALIERDDKQDWLFYYQNSVTVAMKQAHTVWITPRGDVWWDFQANGYQYTYYPKHGWRQVAFGQVAGFTATAFFRHLTKLQNGTVLGAEYDATPTVQGFRQFQNQASGAYYVSDNGTNIKYQLDAGDVPVSGEIHRDFCFHKIVLNRTLDAATQGTFECKVYRNRQTSSFKTWTALEKSDPRLPLYFATDDARLGFTWRLVINSSATPETLNTGNILQLDSIEFWGETRTRSKQAQVQLWNQAAPTGTTDDVIDTPIDVAEPVIVCGATITQVNPEFLWDDVTGAAGYQFTLSANADFSSPIVEELALVDSYYLYEGSLEPGTYYWRVRAFADNGFTTYYSDWVTCSSGIAAYFQWVTDTSTTVSMRWGNLPLSTVNVRIERIGDLNSDTSSHAEYRSAGTMAVTATPFVDTNLLPGCEYTYKLIAIDGDLNETEPCDTINGYTNPEGAICVRYVGEGGTIGGSGASDVRRTQDSQAYDGGEYFGDSVSYNQVTVQFTLKNLANSEDGHKKIWGRDEIEDIGMGAFLNKVYISKYNDNLYLTLYTFAYSGTGLNFDEQLPATDEDFGGEGGTMCPVGETHTFTYVFSIAHDQEGANWLSDVYVYKDGNRYGSYHASTSNKPNLRFGTGHWWYGHYTHHYFMAFNAPTAVMDEFRVFFYPFDDALVTATYGKILRDHPYLLYRWGFDNFSNEATYTYPKEYDEFGAVIIDPPRNSSLQSDPNVIAADYTDISGRYPEVGNTGFSFKHLVEPLLTYSVVTPQVPILLSPTTGSVVDVSSPLTFLWLGIGAEHYEIQISSDPGFITIVYSDTSVMAQEVAPTLSLLANTNYYWRVRGVSGATYGTWSAPFVFTNNVIDTTDFDNPIGGLIAEPFDTEEQQDFDNPTSSVTAEPFDTEIVQDFDNPTSEIVSV